MSETHQDELTLDQVTDFFDEIQDMMDRHENLHPCILFDHEDKEYRIGPHSESVDKNDYTEIVIEHEDLDKLVTLYKKGKESGNLSDVLSAVTQLLKRLTEHENKITNPNSMPISQEPESKGDDES